MKKKQVNFSPTERRKIFLIMKFSVFILLASFINVSASVYSQNSLLDLDLKSASVEQVINEIRNQSDYNLLYRSDLFSELPEVNIRYKGATIEKILDQVIVPFGVAYEIDDNTIIFRKADPVSEVTTNQVKKQITGKVTNSNGEPLPGASVAVKGSSVGVITDAEGNYSLEVPDNAEILEISFVGMKMQEIVIGAQKVINVVLLDSTTGIGEVVVTALGIKRAEKTLTYATQTVGGDELRKTNDINFMNSLSGKTSGVEIKKNSSGAGGSTKVILRGNKSLSGTSEPLYVIDGIPMANVKGGQPGMWGGIDGGDGLSQINPDDIESISVLKGSNAAVLYGSQGANGVILITTKKGVAGKAKVQISSGVTFESILEMPALQFEYGSVGGAKESWSTEKGDYDNSFVNDFFDTGINMLNSASVSGGNNRTTAYFSYANTSSSGVVPGNKYQKNNVTFKQSTKLLNDRLVVSSNVMLTDEVTNNRNPAGYYLNPLTGLYFFPRDRDFNEYKDNYEVFNETRNMNLHNWFVEDHHQSNPYWILNRQAKEDNVKRVISSVTLDYKIMDNLKFQVRGSYDFSNRSQERQHHAGSNGTNVHKNGAWDYYSVTDELIYSDAILSYDNNFGDISLDVIAGASFQQSTYGAGVNVSTGVVGLKYANVFSFQNIESNVIVNSVYGSKVIKEAVFSNVQLGYKDMIFLDISGRNDWASTLAGTGNESYFYPSFGLSALISEMVSLPDFVSFGKVRASYTSVANEVPFNMISPNHTITLSGVALNTTKPFTNLKPEILKSVEIGTDWRFFDGRLGFDFTYYNINSQDQFINLPAPSGSGYTRYFVNAGEVVNSGVEFSLNAKPVVSKDFMWSTSLNFSKNTNLIVELHEDLGDQINISDSEGYQLLIKKGGSFGDLYVHKFLRDDQGRIMLDENGAIRKTDLKEYIGNSNPDWSLGWYNSLQYKDFSLGFLINGKFGGKVISQTQAMLDGYGVSQATADARNIGGVTIDAVMPDGTAVTTMDAETYYRAIGMRNGIKEPYTYDRTNIRLSQISLAYNLDLRNSSLPIDGLTISLVGQNLFFLYKVAPFDPELAMNTSNAYQSLDNFNLPSTRAIGFNVKITF